jgi:hypothetical protein
MTYRFDSPYIGYPPIEDVVPVPADPPRGLPISPGFLARAEDPVWGPGEFVFARAGAGIRIYGLCQFLPVWDATNKVFTYNMVESTATANAGRPYYVYQGNVALTTGQYGWFQTAGRSPVNGTATIAADTKAGHNGAGQLTADAATFGIDGAMVITPATQTVVSAGSGLIGDTRINLVSTDGFFVGGYLSGTGVGAAAIVQSVNPNGKFVIATVANSAAVIGNVTVTYNNATIFYNVLEMNRMHGSDEA